MKHIIAFSGGKDSLATVLWSIDNLESFEIVFCDTGWEAEETYKYIVDIQNYLNIDFTILKPEFDFVELALKKKRVPSSQARFCTEHLKIRPMIDYILSLNENTIVYQGIRWDESNNRAKMKREDEYFKLYDQGDKRAKYRKKDVLKYLEKYTVDVIRPIIHLTANEVFDLARSKNTPINPLYKKGFSRVGCFPCVMCRHSEIKQMIKHYPARIDKIRALEKDLARSFFSPGFIPDRFCTQVDLVSGKKYPSVDDVVHYLKDDENQLRLFPKNKCQSIYNICE